jgi:hypothetical protein
MANRSKKVVLSARIDPFLKSGIDVLSELTNEKIVKLLESFIESGLNDQVVKNPFSDAPGNKEISLMQLLQSLWTEDEVLHQLRLGLLSGLGVKCSNDELCAITAVVLENKRFKGECDLFDGVTTLSEEPESVRFRYMVDIGRVKDEWETLKTYSMFAKNNRPLTISYDQFLSVVGIQQDYSKVVL